jgi:hypothetical protein
MNDTDTPLGAPAGFSLADFHQNKGWFLGMGILLISVGTLAIIYDFMATLISVFFFGWILIFMGAYEAVQAFWQTKWGGLFLNLAMGILAVVVGFHLVTSPSGRILYGNRHFPDRGVPDHALSQLGLGALQRHCQLNSGRVDQAAMAALGALDYRPVHRH